MSEESVGSRAASGIALTIALGLIARAFSLVVNVFITRYVSPGDYGEANGAAVLAGTAAAFSSFGLGAYLVAHPKEDRRVTWHVTVYGMLSCAILLGVVWLTRGALSSFFKLPNVMRYLPYFVASVLLERSSLVMEKLLLRQLRYRTLGITSSLAEASFAITTLTCVLLGYGAMSIAFANIVRAVLKVVIYGKAVDRAEWFSPGPLTWEITRRLIRFGAPITLGGVSDFVGRRWDNLLTSRLFGASMMGAYNSAYNLAEMPSVTVGERVGDALLPAFAHLRLEDRLPGLLRAIRLLSLLLFPIAVGLGAISESAVQAFFDPSWYAVAPMLTILSGISVARPLSYSVAMYLQAGGRTASSAGLDICKTIVLLLLMWLVGPMGPLWICGAVVFTLGFQAALLLFFVGQTGGHLWQSLSAPVRPLIACIPMVAAVFATRQFVHAHISAAPLVSLLLEIVIDGVVFVASAFVFARPIALDLLAVGKRMLARRRGR